ncbi:MAG TPA: sigma-70 family RNA polymerase sigma factor [Thermomicrobiales bacterium]|nr:sigma-70 family RNA polymerase sigma factor [Thermomicrobiales bacterium]
MGVPVLFSLRIRRLGGRADVTSRPEDDAAHSDAPDADLIARARNGNLAAFNLLVARHERAVFSVAVRYMRAREPAEDVTQDTFVRAFQSIDTFRNDAGEGFRTWLLRIAANRALDVIRARNRRPADSLDARLDDEEQVWEPEAGDESAFDFAARDALGRQLERALGLIHPDQRLAVILSDIHGHSYEEVAEITGVALGTVKSRINRGRARLRELLLEDATGRELLGRFGRLESDAERG